MKRQYSKMIFIPIYILFFMFNFTHFIIAEDEEVITLNEETTSKKREINADSLKWEYEARIAVFSGSVIMNGEEGEIRCLKMTVFFDEKDEIEKMIGEGTATLTRKKQKGGGEIIEIYPADNLIILKDNAWISSDKALFKGQEITFDTTKDVINIVKGVKGEIQTGNSK